MPGERDGFEEHSAGHEPYRRPWGERIKRASGWLGVAAVGVFVSQKTGNTEGVVDNLAWGFSFATGMIGVANAFAELADLQ